ncbi:hypothetical protein D3C72_908750 [compost metagenome]
MAQCVAGLSNSVADRRTLEVSHPGQGLENAALAVVRRGQIGQRNGVAVGQAFRIKLNCLDDASEPAPTPKNNVEATPPLKLAERPAWLANFRLRCRSAFPLPTHCGHLRFRRLSFC